MAETGAKSYRTTIAGAIAGLGTVSGLIVQLGFADTPWGSKVMAICTAIIGLAAAWGFSQTKDKQVTGVGKDAVDLSK